MRRWIESFLRGEAPGLAPLLLRLPLIPPALLFGGITALRRRLFFRGVLSAERLPLPVISIGNLVAGGTGKTPFIRRLASLLEEAGEEPCVLGRGYGARGAGSTLDEEGASLARDLPGVPVAQGRDRALALRPLLSTPRPPRCVLLDDGGQTLRYQRDLDVFLVDASAPFGSGWPLPAGVLREFPGGALSAADAVVLTRSDQVEPESLKRLEATLRRKAPSALLVRGIHRPLRLLPDDEDPALLAGRRVVLVSGIAHPAAFRRTVESLGAEVVAQLAFADHHPFAEAEVAAARARAKELDADFVLATGKDEPKLRALVGDDSAWRFLEVEVELEGEGWSRFLALVRERLESCRAS